MVVNQPAGMVTAKVFLIAESSRVGRFTGPATNCFIGSGLEKFVRFYSIVIKANKHTGWESPSAVSNFLNFQKLALLSCSADNCSCEDAVITLYPQDASIHVYLQIPRHRHWEGSKANGAELESRF